MLRRFVWVNGSFKTAPWFSCCCLKLFNTQLWIKSEGVKVDVVVGLYVRPTWTQEVKVQLLTDLRLIIMSVTQISLYTRNDQLDSSLLCVCGLKSSISWQSLIAVSSSVCVCVCVSVCVCVIWHHRHEVIAMRPSVPPERSSKGFHVTKTCVCVCVCVCVCYQEFENRRPFSMTSLPVDCLINDFVYRRSADVGLSLCDVSMCFSVRRFLFT